MAMRYRVGEPAGAYVIRRHVNTGMFALSYEAADSCGKKVFLKQYKSPSPLVRWYEDYKRHQGKLRQRISNASQLSERTYEFIDMFEHKKAFIQVYGFIENGKDLKEYLAEGGMSNEQRFTFASLLLYTLKLFHKAGIVHTDLKPDNVYLMPSESRMGYNLKLIDFDFTVLDGQKSPWDKSLAGDAGMNYCGTPRYMSPEHLRSEMPVDRSDVFTAAIICYELLTRNGHPFPEDESAYRDAVLAGTFSPPDFVIEHSNDALAAFACLLEKALSPSSNDRPGVDELHNALLKCRNCFTDVGGGRKIPDGNKSNPKPAPKPNKSKPLEKKPQAKSQRKIKVGLSMKDGSAIDWIRSSTDFGSHSQVDAVKPYRLYCSGRQFALRCEGTDWFIDPAPTLPKNMVVLNGQELTESHKLADGDVIAHGSRKDPARRNIAPMVVHLEEY